MSAENRVRCHCVQLATTVIEGREGNFSLINLIEGIQIVKGVLGLPVPFEVVSFWTFPKELVGKSIETKVVIIGDGYDEVSLTETNQHKFTISGGQSGFMPRARMRARGFKLPKVFGAYRLHMAWREEGAADWTLSDASWYFLLNEHPQSAEKAVAEQTSVNSDRI